MDSLTHARFSLEVRRQVFCLTPVPRLSLKIACNGLANLVRTVPVAANKSLGLSISLAVRDKPCNSQQIIHQVGGAEMRPHGALTEGGALEAARSFRT